MKWAWTLGRVAGIEVKVHATFAILVLWIATLAWQAERSLEAVALAVAFILALFACIVLHEFGHALAARRYGIRTRDITLLPIGGLARLERMPKEPRQELLVALAGPLVNLVIALVLGGLLDATGQWHTESGADPLTGPFFQRLVGVNLIIVAFNLLPAFPMDGGRALRAILASRMDYVAATQVAANLGQAMAFFFGFVGLLTNPFLLFIALFVWIGAAAEASMVQINAALAGIPVAQAMIRDFRTLSPDDRLSHAVALTLAGSQRDFPIVERGELKGVLTQEGLLSALGSDGESALVGAVATDAVRAVDSHDMLEGVLAGFEAPLPRTTPVTHDGALVGILTMENVGELLRIQAALDKPGRRKLPRAPLPRRSGAGDALG